MRLVSLFIAMKVKNNISINTIWLPRKYFRKSECDHVKTNSSEYHCRDDVSKLTCIEVHRQKKTKYSLHKLSTTTCLMRQTWPDEVMKIIKCNEQSKIMFCRVTKWATDSKPATDDNGEDVTWSYVRRISWAKVEKAAVSLVTRSRSRMELSSILLLVANSHQICIKCTNADVRLRTPDDGRKGCPKYVES